MGLVRTVLALMVLLILVDTGFVFWGVGEGANPLAEAIRALGTLLESPAALLGFHGFYTTALVAAAGYFAFYLALGWWE